MSGLAFHEKAGRRQVILWLGKFITDVFLCPDSGCSCGWRGGCHGRAQRVHLEP